MLWKLRGNDLPLNGEPKIYFILADVILHNNKMKQRIFLIRRTSFISTFWNGIMYFKVVFFIYLTKQKKKSYLTMTFMLT